MGMSGLPPHGLIIYAHANCKEVGWQEGAGLIECILNQKEEGETKVS